MKIKTLISALLRKLRLLNIVDKTRYIYIYINIY